MVLGNEELKAKSSNPGKEVRVLLINARMPVTKPKKANYLRKKEWTFLTIVKGNKNKCVLSEFMRVVVGVQPY